MSYRPLILSAVAFCATLSLLGDSTLTPDPTRGRGLFEKRCTGCHEVDQVKAGPPLRAVFGRPAATHSQFPYSDNLRRARLSWDAATLDKWLADPDALVPGNDMSFRLDNAGERADIIAYLKQLGGK